MVWMQWDGDASLKLKNIVNYYILHSRRINEMNAERKTIYISLDTNIRRFIWNMSLG